jgi:SAM-dependent methyltransferase
MRCLNLGCGDFKKEGYINLDFNKNFNPDVVHDLNKFPYPFQANEFDLVEAYQCLEHLNNLVRVMEEIYRITKNKARIIIEVPHYQSPSAWCSATHKQQFSHTTFNDFDKTYNESYGNCDFQVLKNELQWFRERHGMLVRAVRPLIEWLGKFRPYYAEKFLIGITGGFDTIRFELKTIKPMRKGGIKKRMSKI